MNKKKVLSAVLVVVFSILIIVNIILFYAEGQRLQRTKLSLEAEVRDLQKSLEDKKVEYDNLVAEHGNCPQ